MSFAEVKESVAEMFSEERLEVAALNRAEDPEYQVELDGRMSAMDAGHKTSAPAFKKLHDAAD